MTAHSQAGEGGEAVVTSGLEDHQSACALGVPRAIDSVARNSSTTER
jgi:hypothetical protein